MSDDSEKRESTRVFIEPDEEELAQAGALDNRGSGEDSVSMSGDEFAPRFDAEWPKDFKALWRILQQLPTEEILERVADQFEDAPDRRREILSTWMAQELGYSRVLRRRSSLTREPLWDVLSASEYAELTERGEQALAMIGRSLQPARTYMHPSAALATLALWRHSRDEELRHEAEQRLATRAMPDEPEWLYEVVDVFLKDSLDGDQDRSEGRTLQALVRLVLDHRYWEVAALLSALVLVHRYGKWYHSAVVSNLVHACDVASQQYPHEARCWIELMTEAAMGGKLSFSWLEAPVKAAIRLSVDDHDHQQVLRKFVAQRGFEADHRRLVQLYDEPLKQLRKQGDKEVRHWLLEEVRQTVDTNPSRAQRLLELMAAYELGGRVGTLEGRIRQAVDILLARDEMETLDAWLIGLYVANATLESHAAQLVRYRGEQIDWTANPFADQDDYAMYLVISDYERAFEQLTCKFDGVTLEHADKYAAARIKFFVQKRIDPSGIHRLVQTAFAPVEWLGAGLSEIGLISEAIDRGMEHFERRVRHQALADDVLLQFQEAGVEIETFDDIAGLPVDQVEDVLQSQRNRRLLLGAVAGGISGGLAPFSWGVLSLADIPVMLSITADISSRFCWYFGFDPRENPDLPMEILAVALGGTRPAAIEPMLVRQNLHEHVLRKSLVVGAVAHGGMTHLTGKGLSRVVQKKMGKSATQRAGELARRAVSKNLHRRAIHTRSSRALPLVGAILGAVLNTALLYDICEAAQAVLTDRFLERKYPQWVRHIAHHEAAEEQAAR